MKTILVIEDQPEVRSNIVELLEAENFATLSAEDGLMGLQLAREKRPDLIICDIMMPEFDGYDVLHQIHQDPNTSTIPFIFLTAKADTKDLRQGMNLGADDYLTKPFSRLELLQTIQARLSKQTILEEQAEQQIQGLRQSLTYSIPDKVLNPLDEITRTSSILLRDFATIEPQDFKQLAEHLHQQAQISQRAIKNFFLYMHIEFLARDAEALQSLHGSYTMRPGDFIYMVSMQKAKDYQRIRDLKAKTENVPLRIATDDLKKTVEEMLDFALMVSTANQPIVIQTHITADHFQYTVESSVEDLSSDLLALLSGQPQPLSRETYETLDPGLGLLLTQRIATLYGGDMTLQMRDSDQLSLTVSLPLKPSEEG